MAKGAKVQRWYPDKSAFPDTKQYDTVRKLVDLIYSLQDSQTTLAAKQGESEAAIQKQAGRIDKTEKAGGPSTTKIGGLFVKAVPPANGQTLKYNSASGQIEWT